MNRSSSGGIEQPGDEGWAARAVQSIARSALKVDGQLRLADAAM
jgi:hypothetical protein